MVEPVQEWIADNFNTQRISQKEDRKQSVEKDLIAEAE
jgi:hypothetical protein